MRLNDLSGKIIGLCMEIHRELGSGLLESAYKECLAYEISRIGLQYERQQPLLVRYKVMTMREGASLAHCATTRRTTLPLPLP
jgi:GxxExxY protein